MIVAKTGRGGNQGVYVRSSTDAALLPHGRRHRALDGGEQCAGAGRFLQHHKNIGSGQTRGQKRIVTTRQQNRRGEIAATAQQLQQLKSG